MPRITERAALLSVLRETQADLGIQLAAQIIMNETWAIGEDEDAENDEAEEEEMMVEQETRDLFQLTGFSMMDSLRRMQEEIEGSRYLENRVWRGLREGRQTTLEWYFSMNKNWFRNQVSLCLLSTMRVRVIKHTTPDSCPLLKFRVDHSGFHRILQAIRDDEIFRNRSRNPQQPVEYQLMCLCSAGTLWQRGQCDLGSEKLPYCWYVVSVASAIRMSVKFLGEAANQRTIMLPTP